MPRTPDRRSGTLEEEEILLDDRTSDGDPIDERAIRYVNGAFRLKDSIGVFDPRGGGSLTAEQHKALLQLIHFVDEGPAEGFASGATKTITGTLFPSQILWRRADATKLVEQNITWSGVIATSVQWKVYASDGSTVLATLTDAISYTGVFETGRTRTIA